MQEKRKEKLIKIIDYILFQENPTLEDEWDKILITKYYFTEEGVTKEEAVNILKFLEYKKLLSFGSAIEYFDFVMGEGEIVIDEEKGTPLSEEEKREFLNNSYIVVKPDFEKLEGYRDRLLKFSVGKEKIKQVSEKIKFNNQDKISYNGKTKILYFKGAEIDFSRAQMQADLLNTLFKKPKDDWNNDEIFEDWGEEIDKRNGRISKFYTAGREINLAIAIEARVRDFLMLSMKMIKINEKYHNNIVR
ncbi:MAG: hypothetical protein WC582_00200 [Patescibacteria group bacterium]